MKKVILTSLVVSFAITASSQSILTFTDVEKLSDEGKLSEDVSGHDLDFEQIDEIVCSVFKGLYYEKA